MGVRHKAYKATLDRGYASEWNDDHITDFTDEITHDFNLITTAITTEWDTAQTSGGSAPTISMVSGHAFVVLNTGVVTNNTSSMRAKLGGSANNITNANDLPILSCSVDIAAVHTSGTVVEFGFQKYDDTIFTTNKNHALFRVKDNKLYAVCGDGTSETETLIGDFNQYGHYRIEFTSTSVKFYVDNMVTAAAVITTHIPTNDITIKFSVVSQNNVNSTIRIDGCSLTILRKK